MDPTPTLFDLKDRSVLVTGANRGLGAALCKTILQYSPKIIHAGYRTTPGDFEDPRISWVRLDIKDSASVVAAAASCAFLTPIGHKNNTLIMGPGGYGFGDYWRMGLPLELLVVATAIPMILLVWPL